MSGDLKDAGKSLPMGTFLAVGVSIVVYFLASLTFGGLLAQRNPAKRLQRHGPGGRRRAFDNSRGDCGNAFICHGLISGRTTDFAVAGWRSNFSVSDTLCQGCRPNR